MKKLFVCVFLCLCSIELFSIEKVTFQQLQAGDWERLKGQVVEITTPLVVCGTFYDSLLLAPERLFVPEETAKGLANGDSTQYYLLKQYNNQKKIKLECKYPYSLNLGSTVKNLKAQIMGERHLLTGSQPHFKNYKPKKHIEKPKDADILILSSNIQNYFVHQGGYATKRNTEGQHSLQCYKVASAFTRINADLYALCELEKGSSAPEELTNKMNELSKKKTYQFVNTNTTDGDTISVGFIYNSDVLQPYSQLVFAYQNPNNIYYNRFLLQGFEHKKTGERFVVSLSHLRSKRGNDAIPKQMNNVHNLLYCIDKAYKDSIYTDPDIILLGDFNSYTQEQPLQKIIKSGYIDMLQINNTDYSYSYKGECGYLDRVFASPAMAKQIIYVKPIHWNTDYYYSAAYYSKYNYKNRQIPKEKPQNIRKVMSKAAKRNLLFRFSDHDPILIGIKF